MVSARDGEQWDGPGVEAWQPWEPGELARRLAGTTASCCVVGGWSIDLFVGRMTRPHQDLEIATTRQDVPAIRRQLPGLVFHAVGDGTVRRLADDEPSPLDRHQHWVLDDEAGAWKVDVMVEPGDRELWVFRRDQRIAAPRAKMVATASGGIPYLKPHGSLLYKAKYHVAKDEADFAAVVDLMDTADRQWLRARLELVHPGHPWLDRLP